MMRYMVNSFVMATSGTLIRLIFSVCAAYGLTHFDFKCKNLVFFLILGTMMLPGDTLLITNYVTVSHMGLLNTYLGMIIVSFVSASQMFDFISYFFDDYYKLEDEIPEQVSQEDAAKILDAYLATYDHSDEQPVWFDKIRTLGTELGYAAKPKDFKKNPDDYKGHVGHVSGVIRLAIVGRASSPDVWEIQQILGEERTKARIAKMRESL
jgi:hypothetical protein